MNKVPPDSKILFGMVAIAVGGGVYTVTKKIMTDTSLQFGKRHSLYCREDNIPVGLYGAGSSLPTNDNELKHDTNTDIYKHFVFFK